jgi:hypothetical protein
MLPADYLKRLRLVEVRARLVSEQLMGGRMASVFKGRGMDFADVREYVPGDDVRRIDWNVTARLRKPFIKRHVEERELVVMLLVDLSASGHFGTASGDTAAETMREQAAILAGALAFSAVRDGDRVGAILFTDRDNHCVRSISPDGVVGTVAGTPGTKGSTNGAGGQSQFNAPHGINVLNDGSIAVADSGNGQVRLIESAEGTAAAADKDVRGDGRELAHHSAPECTEESPGAAARR